jgi:hypothetical protein
MPQVDRAKALSYNTGMMKHNQEQQMSWNKEGQRVAGVYLNAYTVQGLVTESRVKYGGKVQHTVQLDQPLQIFGRTAEVLLLDEQELFAV